MKNSIEQSNHVYVYFFGKETFSIGIRFTEKISTNL